MTEKLISDELKEKMDKFFFKWSGKEKKKILKNNVLITGISGFVGSHLANLLKTRGDNIIGIVRDVIPSEWLRRTLDSVTMINGDIRNYNLIKRIIEHYKINQIYHTAAFANVKQAHKNPMEVFDTNVMGTLSILEACRQSNNFNLDSKINTNYDGEILILNTDKVYGEKIDAIETDRYESSEPYATSKCCQGFLVQTYQKTYNINIKMAHSCNIFGYDPFNDRLIPNVIKSCIRKISPKIYTNDLSVREYVYIDDLTEALYLLMNDETYEHNVYNIRTGWIYNQKDIILEILKYFNEISAKEILPVYEEGNVPMQIQNESMQSINWNWKPEWTFENAIKTTADTFLVYKDDWF